MLVSDQVSPPPNRPWQEVQAVESLDDPVALLESLLTRYRDAGAWERFIPDNTWNAYETNERLACGKHIRIFMHKTDFPDRKNMMDTKRFVFQVLDFNEHNNTPTSGEGKLYYGEVFVKN